MNIKKLAVLIVLFLFTFAESNKALANTAFKDVTPENSAYNEINYLVDLGIISGYTENGKKYFKPLNNVTRGQVIKMVILAAGYKPVVSKTSSFVDLDPKKSPELSSYVESAVKNGILTVPADKKLNAMTPIKRDEMSKLLALAFKFNVEQYAHLSLPFKDMKRDDPYYKYVAAIYYNGITKGNTAGDAYNATENVKRSQFSSFVARALSEQYRLDLPVQGVTVPTEEAALKKVYVNTNGLNVRSTPTSVNSSNILGKVNMNEQLYVYENLNGWLKIGYKGQFAYVASQYTQDQPVLGQIVDVGSNPSFNEGETPNTEATEPPERPAPVITTNVKGIATVNALSIRATPSSSAKLLHKINRGTEVAVHSIEGNWAKITYNGIEGYIHKTYLRLLNLQGPAVAGRIIVLDPGHGGKDPGAKFVYPDRSEVYEKDIVLKVANLVRQKLEKDGAIVKMTRSDDRFIELPDRVRFTQNNFAEMFISIHVNSVNNTAASGTETYYSKAANDNEKEDAVLAAAINNQIVQNVQMKDRKVKRENYYVITGVVMPAVLVELGFISNEGDRNKMLNDAYVEIYAQSIYNGIVEYYSK